MPTIDLIWNSIPIKDQVTIIRQEQLALITRVSKMENEFQSGLCVRVLSLLSQIASPREWAIGLAILLLLAVGVVSPAEIKAFFLSAHGGE